MILDIVKFPDKTLRKKTKPVEKVSDDILEKLNNMAETMYNAPGVGLAAPQVGIDKRLVVMDITAEDEPPKLEKLINPEVLEYEGEQTGEEGCLSLPGEYADVKRAEWIRYKYIDENGDEHLQEATGLRARVIQHEVDHLDGILFIDKLSTMKRDMIKKRIKKRISQGDY
ncbi:Peptide deformylase [Flexistipes sinusarabici DSM 4947]|uniref:Peptide deformylase n=2 Tax=Flexistipes sinusarabici TaxID=2352 RepID=F8E5Y8_FLESM|nr:peptide deformylase [Flexistipes sinusarabici]AEI15829.1 Peptide deformylase [Flexistipes sinusarabici DSM 4947]